MRVQVFYEDQTYSILFIPHLIIYVRNFATIHNELTRIIVVIKEQSPYIRRF
jgi:hypothetical protein